MTLMIRRRAIVLFVVFEALLVLLISLFARDQMQAAVSAPDSVKLLTERVLYAAIVAVVLAILAGVALARRSRNLTALLDKLATMSELSGVSADTTIQRLGDIGVRISRIYHRVSDLSDKKSRKISALTALNELLLNLTDQMLLVIDPSGKVIQASTAALDRLGRSRPETIGIQADDLMPDAHVSAAIEEAAKSHAPVVRERDGNPVALNPVINRDGEVAYLVVVLTRTVADEMKKLSVTVKTATSRRDDSSIFGRVLRRRARGQKR